MKLWFSEEENDSDSYAPDGYNRLKELHSVSHLFMIKSIWKYRRGKSKLKGAVPSWPNPAGSWCQKLSEVGIRAPATVASQPESRSPLANLPLRFY